MGPRLALNDASDADVLGGFIVDRTSGATLLRLEAGRRLSDGWTASLEARGFSGIGAEDPLHPLRRDSHLSFVVTRWF